MGITNLTRVFSTNALFILLFFGFGCTSLKVGESWKMAPKDQTIGLTLLWELPEAQLKAMLPADQQPRIRNGKGVLMLFLAHTTAYSLGAEPKGPLGVAHLIVPLDGSIALPSTLVAKKQALFSVLKQLDFAVEEGEVSLNLQESSGSTNVQGSLVFPEGSLTFSGSTTAPKGNLVDLPQTTLVGKFHHTNLLSGPESYRPIPFEKIEIQADGQHWMSRFGLTSPPDRIWVNVDFGVEFFYFKKLNAVKLIKQR
jgi:hypothetical protein